MKCKFLFCIAAMAMAAAARADVVPSAPADKTAPATGKPAAAPVPEPPMPPNMIQARPNDHPLYCESGDIIRIKGHIDSTRGLSSSFLEVDGQSEQETNLTGALGDDFTFDWLANHADAHELRVGYVLDNGRKTYPLKLQIDVLTTAPVILEGFQQTAISDFTVGIEAISGADFSPTYARFYLNGKLVESKPSMHAVLPISKLKPGTYSFRYDALDGRDSRFSSVRQTIQVPERVGAMSPTTAVIEKPKDKTTFSVAITPGLKVAKVDYWVNGQVVATGSTNPFSADADLSAITSGSYPGMARVTSADGTTYDSPGITVALVNKPDDASKVVVAPSPPKVDLEVEAVLKADRERKQKKLVDANANTPAATKSHLVSFVPRGKITNQVVDKETDYFITLKIINDSVKFIGPFTPKLIFDDNSEAILLGYDPSTIGADGRPTGLLEDGDMIIPGSGSEIFPYFATVASDAKSKKPVSIQLYPGIFVPVMR